MNNFSYNNGVLHAESVPLNELEAQLGSPLYIYSRAHLESRFLAYQQALEGHDHLLCYAVKANSNIAVLNVLAKLGAGFDIVSQGELERVIAAGGDPRKTVFSGVAKTSTEMEFALNAGILCFNVESIPELERLNEVALRLGKKAGISLRINPDVDANTHPYISTGLRDNKFGIAIEEAPQAYQQAASMPGLEILGADCHIGSQLTELSPFSDALVRLLNMIDSLANQGINLGHLDLGGGLGVRYDDENPPSPEDYIQNILSIMQERQGKELTLIFEPGRSICANAGVLLTKVEYIKKGQEKNFAIVDAAMNDMLRPALYQAYMKILPVQEQSDTNSARYDVVGPVCESGDFLGKDRDLSIAAGDLLALMSAGAYGFTMSSNYNSRNRCAEIMIDGDKIHLIRKRETYEDQLRLESVIKD